MPSCFSEKSIKLDNQEFSGLSKESISPSKNIDIFFLHSFCPHCNIT